MNTAQFLTRVRELAQLPNVDEDWTDAEILAEATESLLERYTQAISDPVSYTHLTLPTNREV